MVRNVFGDAGQELLHGPSGFRAVRRHQHGLSVEGIRKHRANNPCGLAANRLKQCQFFGRITCVNRESRRYFLASSRLESRAVSCQSGAYTESASEIGIDEMAEHFLRAPLTRYGPSEQQFAAHVSKGRSNRLDGCQVFLNDIA